MLNALGKTLVFSVPSAPQEKIRLPWMMSICMTPAPRFLNMDCLACSFLNEWIRPWPVNLQTFMLPSAEPVVKNSSQGSRDRALMAESCAWNVWISCLCLMSKMQTHPFLPPDIKSWCFGAYWSTVAPWSWHVKPWMRLFPGDIKVSQRHTFLIKKQQ